MSGGGRIPFPLYPLVHSEPIRTQKLAFADVLSDVKFSGEPSTCILHNSEKDALFSTFHRWRCQERHIICGRIHHLQSTNYSHKNIFPISKPFSVTRSSLFRLQKKPSGGITTVSASSRGRGRASRVFSGGRWDWGLTGRAPRCRPGWGGLSGSGSPLWGSPPSQGQAARPGHGPEPRGATVAGRGRRRHSGPPPPLPPPPGPRRASPCHAGCWWWAPG